MSRAYRKAYRQVKYDHKMHQWARAKRLQAERDVATWALQEQDYKTKHEDSIIELSRVCDREDSVAKMVEANMKKQETVK